MSKSTSTIDAAVSGALEGCYQPLSLTALMGRVRASQPGATPEQVEASLRRLAALGHVTVTGARESLQAHPHFKMRAREIGGRGGSRE